MRPRRVIGLVVPALIALAALMPAAGDSGVVGGASALYFTQAKNFENYINFTTNAKVTQILEIDWSCRTLSTGENDLDGGAIKLKHLAYQGKIKLGHSEYSSKLDGLGPPVIVKGYLKVKFASKQGPVTGTINAPGCMKNKKLKLDMSPGET